MLKQKKNKHLYIYVCEKKLWLHYYSLTYFVTGSRTEPDNYYRMESISYRHMDSPTYLGYLRYQPEANAILLLFHDRQYAYPRYHRVEFYDSEMKRIPESVVMERYENAQYRYIRAGRYNPTTFRKAPVPGTTHASWHKGKGVKIRSEVRSNKALALRDEDMDIAISVRGKRSSVLREDRETFRKQCTNWKKYRKTQWRSQEH